MTLPHRYRVSIQPMTTANVLPLPAETTAAQGKASQIIICQDGGGEAVEFRPSTIDIDAVESQTPVRDVETKLPAILTDTLDQTTINPDVRAFADNAVKGKERLRLGGSKQKGGISAERVAAAVVSGCRTEKREVIVPWQHHISVKFYQLFPGLVESVMSRMIGPDDSAAHESAQRESRP
jgi:hypothetical protein